MGPARSLCMRFASRHRLAAVTPARVPAHGMRRYQPRPSFVVAQLFAFIKNSSEGVGAALAQAVGANIASGGISIKSLDPDMDGNGKVDAFELDMYKRIKSADVDGSGSISVKELFAVIKGAAESDKSKKLFQRLFVVSLLVIVLLSGAMCARGRQYL